MALASRRPVRFSGVGMDERGAEQFDLLLRLAGLDQKDFSAALDQAIKDGYVTKPEFERFVHLFAEKLESQQKLTNERLDGQDEMLKLKVENVELRLKALNQDGFDKYVEDKLPGAVAQLHRDQRSDLVNFFRKRFMLIVSIIMTVTAGLSLWAAIQSSTELRDLKNIARVANEFNDALDP